MLFMNILETKHARILAHLGPYCPALFYRIFFFCYFFFALQFHYFCLENSLISIFLPAEFHDFQLRDTVTFCQVLRCLCEVVMQFILYILSIFFSKNLKMKYVAFHRRWQMVVTLMWKAAGGSAIMVNAPIQQ